MSRRYLFLTGTKGILHIPHSWEHAIIDRVQFLVWDTLDVKVILVHFSNTYRLCPGGFKDPCAMTEESHDLRFCFWVVLAESYSVLQMDSTSLAFHYSVVRGTSDT